MSNIQKAFQSALDEMVEKSSNDLILLLKNESQEDRDFINELCKFSIIKLHFDIPLHTEFVLGIIFYQQYLKFKEQFELEEWNKSTNV